MRGSLLVAALALLTVSAKGGHKSACPFVGEADIDRNGAVQNVVGSDTPKGGASVLAVDGEGQVGKLRMGGSGELAFSGGVPEKVRSSAFVHVLLVDGALTRLHVSEPGKDLPEGVFPDAVSILLADGSGPKVALISIPGETDADACDEIQCKLSGAWKKCWSNCRGD